MSPVLFTLTAPPPFTIMPAPNRPDAEMAPLETSVTGAPGL